MELRHLQFSFNDSEGGSLRRHTGYHQQRRVRERASMFGRQAGGFEVIASQLLGSARSRGNPSYRATPGGCLSARSGYTVSLAAAAPEWVLGVG
jgi:hypothetical protein